MCPVSSIRRTRIFLGGKSYSHPWVAVVVYGGQAAAKLIFMKLCYSDESGCLGVLQSTRSNIQPVFVLGAVILDHRELPDLTRDFLELKKEFFPGLGKTNDFHLDWVLKEIKGLEIRKSVLSTSRNERRWALRFIDKTLALLEKHKARVAAKILIKGIDVPINTRSLYTSHVQYICATYNHFLGVSDDYGIVIADYRTKNLNSNVAHSIFTQKNKADGDSFPHIVELPVFGHSDNHVGLQLADFLVSSLLFPMTSSIFCQSISPNIHVRQGHFILREKFGLRIQKLQYRYQDKSGQWRGGIWVNDLLGQRPGQGLFQ